MSNINQGLRLYCGSKRPVPHGKRLGTQLECFRRGFGIGSYVKEQTFPDRMGQVEAGVRGVVLRQVVRDIETRGLLNFKQQLRLEQLSKDLIRSIAVKLTGTRDEIRGYSSMTREQLINALVQRGWRR